MSDPKLTEARKAFHANLLSSILTIDKDGIPSNADRANKPSVAIAAGIATLLGSSGTAIRGAGQTSGRNFEALCAEFVEATFSKLGHLRPGKWSIAQVSSRNQLTIAQYEQYQHLTLLREAARANPGLAAALGNDYTISPDVIVTREPENDQTINTNEMLVDDDVSRQSNLRVKNNPLPLLHASISCKWTIRSDRAQNSRSEALNLIRNRKGRLPHIVVVTGEPLPSRLASIALGTGDIDCVYHFALYELHATLTASPYLDALDLLNVMIEGKRIKDISDLPLDLAV